MLIYSNQAPARLPALLQSLPLGSRTRALWPLINQDVATPHTWHLHSPLLPRQENSKAMGREATIKRSRTRQGPIQNPKLVLLALTRALYPPDRVCPCVKDDVPRTRWSLCALLLPHLISFYGPAGQCCTTQWLHHSSGVQGMFPCYPGLPKANKREDK